jgi:hypothetical protein
VRPEHEAGYGLERGLVKVDDEGNIADKRGAGQCLKTGLPYNPPWRYAIQAEAFAPNDLAVVLRRALVDASTWTSSPKTRARAEVERAEIAEQIRALGLIAPR